MADVTAMDPALAETVDYLALRRLQSAYADVVTRRAWPELEKLFVPDALVEIDTRDGNVIRIEGPRAFGEFVANAIEQFAFFEFVVLNTVVDIGAGDRMDTADGRVYMCELRSVRESHRWNNAFGVYHDQYRRLDGRWWFTRRRYHSLARTAADGETVDSFDFPRDLVLGGL
jgi:hypothetical protein